MRQPPRPLLDLPRTHEAVCRGGNASFGQEGQGRKGMRDRTDEQSTTEAGGLGAQDVFKGPRWMVGGGGEVSFRME